MNLLESWDEEEEVALCFLFESDLTYIRENLWKNKKNLEILVREHNATYDSGWEMSEKYI